MTTASRRLLGVQVLRAAVSSRLRGTQRLNAPVSTRLQGSMPMQVGARLRGAGRDQVAARLRGGNVLSSTVATRLRGGILMTVPAAARMQGRQVLNQADPVSARLVGVHKLAAASRRETVSPPVLTVAGIAMEVEAIELSHDEGSSVWSASVTLVRLGDYAQTQYDQDATLAWLGESWSLVVVGRELRQDAEVERRPVLQLVSPLVRLSDRYLPPQTYALPAGTARQAVEYLLGQSVTWNLVDWQLPTDVLDWQDTTPLQAARRIAAAAGGLVESLPDGSIIVRHQYPAAVPEWGAAVPDHVLAGLDDIFAMSETGEARVLANRYRVTDGQGATSDAWQLEWVPDEADDYAGELRLYPWPWEATVSGLTTRTGVLLTYLGEQQGEEEEQIEFVGGRGNTAYPVDTLGTVTWLDVDLGSVTAEETALSAAVEAESLALVTYTTRYHAWRVTASTTVDPAVAQLVAADG